MRNEGRGWQLFTSASSHAHCSSGRATRLDTAHMGEPTPHAPARRIVAAFSRCPAALDWAKAEAVAAWGPIELESDVFQFRETEYYVPTMGPELLKVFWVFEWPMDPAELVESKLASNKLRPRMLSYSGIRSRGR